MNSSITSMSPMRMLMGIGLVCATPGIIQNPPPRAHKRERFHVHQLIARQIRHHELVVADLGRGHGSRSAGVRT